MGSWHQYDSNPAVIRHLTLCFGRYSITVATGVQPPKTPQTVAMPASQQPRLGPPGFPLLSRAVRPV